MKAARSDSAAYRSTRRLRALRVTVPLAFLCGIVLSPRLWLTDAREYPLVPVAEGLPRLGAPLDAVVLGALAAALAAVAVARRSRAPVAVALVLVLVLAALDENRWQPWAYQYTLMLAALLLAPGARAGTSDERAAMRAVGTCGLIVVAIYFWSGLSKFNAAFRLDVLPFLLRPLVGEVPPVLAPIGYAVPAIEMAIGLGLVWRRTRRYALGGAVLMHASILLAIGPLGSGWNTVVWPWNLAMVAFVLVVFWRLEATPDRRLLTAVREWPRASRALAAGVALLVVALPVLNLFGRWDSYLSAELYSGASLQGFVLPSREVSERLPASARQHLVSTRNGAVLSLFNWAIDDLNVPAYPARRVFKRVAGELCAGKPSPRALMLVVRERPDVLSGRRTVTAYGCEDLR